MPKRFTDTDKWRNPWFRKLSPVYKALWLYIVDSCDNAGVWMVDGELASFSVGEQLDLSDALTAFGGRVEPLGDGKRWHVVDFVEFQFGKLSDVSKLHIHIRTLQYKHGIGEENQRVSNGYLMGIHTHQDKDKDIYTDTGISISSGESVRGGAIIRDVDRLTPTLVRVKAEFVMNGSTEDEAERFYNHYEAQDWKSGNGQRILKWQAKAKVWITEQKTRESNNGKPKKRGDRNTDGSINIVEYSKQIDEVVESVRAARRSQRGLVHGLSEEADDMAASGLDPRNNLGVADGASRDGV